MNQNVIVDLLFRVGRKVHKDHVTGIRCDKKVAVAISRTLVQTPTHARSSRTCQVGIGFFEEVIAQVNNSKDFCTNLAILIRRLDLHDSRATEHEDGLGISIVGTTMSTFQGVDQGLRTHLGNDLATNLTANLGLVFSSHRRPSRVGKYTEIGLFVFLATSFGRACPGTIIRFATTTIIVGIGEEGRTFAVPNHGSQLLFAMAIRFPGFKFHLVALVCKVLDTRIHRGRETVQVTRNTGSPQPILLGIHHQMPEAASLRCRSRRFHITILVCAGICPRGLVHLENVFALTGHQQVAIRVVHNTIGTEHAFFRRTKGLLVGGFHEQVTSTIVLVTDTLHAVGFLVLGIVQGCLGYSMRHDIADLLNPNTRSRIFRSGHPRLSHRSSCRHGQKHCRYELCSFLHIRILRKIPYLDFFAEMPHLKILSILKSSLAP